jgi:hypothetical protein
LAPAREKQRGRDDGSDRANSSRRRDLAEALLQWSADARQTARAEVHVYEDLEGPHAFGVTAEWPALERVTALEEAARRGLGEYRSVFVLSTRLGPGGADESESYAAPALESFHGVFIPTFVNDLRVPVGTYRRRRAASHPAR